MALSVHMFVEHPNGNRENINETENTPIRNDHGEADVASHDIFYCFIVLNYVCIRMGGIGKQISTFIGPNTDAT
jgi:hypothetical protein